jgi:DNA-binding HxlR family transcriptional regulator
VSWSSSELIVYWEARMPPSETPLPGRPVRGSATGRPIMALLDLLGRRWALRVLWELRSGPVPGFRELQSRCGGISSSVLTDRLTELREAGIVERADDGYRLSARGGELAEVMLLMAKWAADWQPPARP